MGVDFPVADMYSKFDQCAYMLCTYTHNFWQTVFLNQDKIEKGGGGGVERKSEYLS